MPIILSGGSPLRTILRSKVRVTEKQIISVLDSSSVNGHTEILGCEATDEVINFNGVLLQATRVISSQEYGNWLEKENVHSLLCPQHALAMISQMFNDGDIFYACCESAKHNGHSQCDWISQCVSNTKDKKMFMFHQDGSPTSFVSRMVKTPKKIEAGALILATTDSLEDYITRHQKALAA